MNERIFARASLAALGLVLSGCGGDDAAPGDECDRLLTCGIVETQQQLQKCKDERDFAQSDSSSCDACIDQASCGDIEADACKKPCLGVISSVGGDPPPVSEPSPTQPQDPDRPAPSVPAEVQSLCATLDACQIRPSFSVTCAQTYVFGLQSGNTSSLAIRRCDDCLGMQSCDVSACASACQTVL